MTKIKVMIVDDEELDRYIVTRTLNRFDCFGSVIELPDGQDAVELIESPDFEKKWGPPPPTLILLDINMPRMGGFDLLDYLEELRERGTEHWESYVVLMLTSSNNFTDKDRAGGYEIVKGYIEKPITVEDVEAILAEHYGTS